MTAVKVSCLLTNVSATTISTCIIFYSMQTKVFDTCKAQIGAALPCLSINTVSVTSEKITGNSLICNFAVGNSKMKCFDFCWVGGSQGSPKRFKCYSTGEQPDRFDTFLDSHNFRRLQCILVEKKMFSACVINQGYQA